jgi:hypothetical protein
VKPLKQIVVIAALLAVGAATYFWYRSMRWNHYLGVVASIRAEFDSIEGAPPQGIDPGAWKAMVGWIHNYVSQANDRTDATRTAFESLLSDLKARRVSGLGYRTREDILWLHDRVERTTSTTRQYCEKWRDSFDVHLDNVFPSGREFSSSTKEFDRGVSSIHPGVTIGVRLYDASSHSGTDPVCLCHMR